MQRFFTNTIESKFIKNLLSNTPIPLFNTIRQGDYIIEGFTYINNLDIIKCTKSGYFNPIDNENKASYEVLSDDYYFGKKQIGLTKTLKDSYEYYDTATHEYLGNYLRAFRDLKDVNLMPFYNCFSGAYTSDFTFEKIDNKINIFEQQKSFTNSNTTTISEDHYKIIKVPIKFNKDYTIAIDCSSEVLLYPVFICNSKLMSINNTNITNLLNRTPKYQNLVCTEFNEPFVYRIDNIDDENNTNAKLFQTYENYLYLLIQLPSNNSSSIVILEGDYTDESYKIFSIEKMDKIVDNRSSQTFLDSMLFTKLSLLQYSNEVNYPFSDTLIQYLLKYTIDSEESIGENIKLVQNSLVGGDNHPYITPNGIWTDYLRQLIFDESIRRARTTEGYNNYYKLGLLTQLDDIGYIDRNTEKMVNG